MSAPVERLLPRLKKVKRSGRGWVACCPAHDDRDPSLSIDEGQDGRVLLKCHAGCSTEAIVGALGLDVKDLFPEDPGKPFAPRVKASAKESEAARRVWEAAEPVDPAHGYLVRKRLATIPRNVRQIAAARVKELSDWWPTGKSGKLAGLCLVVPIRKNGALASIELIDPEGRKATLKGTTKSGGFWSNGELPESGRLVLCEGFATAASVSEALDGSVVAASVGLSNLRAAAETIRAQRPGLELVIAADLGEGGEPHPVAVEVARSLGCPLAAPPADLGAGGDLNDLATRDGLEAVAQRIEAAEVPEDTEGNPDLEELIGRVARYLRPDVSDRMPEYPVEALGPLADVAKAISAGRQAPTAIAGQSVLITAALLTSGLYDVETIYGDVCPLSLFGLIVAPSGSGKDAVDSVATEAVRAWQKEANRRYLAELERFESAPRRKDEEPAPRPVAPHRICSDLTVEGLRRSFAVGVPAQGVFSSEAAIVLGGHGFSADHRLKTAGNLCSLWTTGTISVIRGGDGRFEAYGLRLSVNLAIQPDAVAGALHDPTLSGIGLWPRFLLAWPREVPPRKALKWNHRTDPRVGAFWRRCSELLDEGIPSDNRPVLTLSDEARAVLGAFLEEMEVRGAKGGDLYDLRPFVLRVTEQATRIAGVLTAWSGHREVNKESALCGVVLATYSLQCWAAALRREADKGSAAALELFKWLAARPGMRATKSEILQFGPNRVRSAAKRDAALSLLQAIGAVDLAGSEVSIVAKPAKSAKSLYFQGLTEANALLNAAKNLLKPGTDGSESAPEPAENKAFSNFSNPAKGCETTEDKGFSSFSNFSNAPTLQNMVRGEV